MEYLVLHESSNRTDGQAWPSSKSFQMEQDLDPAELVCVVYAQLLALNFASEDALARFAKEDARRLPFITLVHQYFRQHSANSILDQLQAIASTLDLTFEDFGVCFPLVYLVTPAPFLLAMHGDHRNELDHVTRQSKYCTTTFPSPESISRSSCTASSTTVVQFNHIEATRRQYLDAWKGDPSKPSVAWDHIMHSTRQRILRALDLEKTMVQTQAELILSPSGTDAEILVTCAALARQQQASGPDHHQSQDKNLPKVISIMTAAGEVGSGTTLASGGRYFSSSVPLREKHVVSGDVMPGIHAQEIQTIEILARDPVLGNVNTRVYDETIQVIENSPASTLILLHVVVGSKTGSSSFSQATLKPILQRFGPTKVLVVIDACQMRIPITSIQSFLEKGFVVLITGSKYFAGTPFAGGVLFPHQQIQDLEKYNALPDGLAEYFTQYAFPPSMPRCRSKASKKPDVGLWMRWETALVNMEPYAKIPLDILDRTKSKYMAQLRQLFQKCKLCSLLVPEKGFSSDDQGDDDEFAAHDTICSFQLFCPTLERHFNMTELKLVSKYMSQDISSLLENVSTMSTRTLGVKMSIGQAVQITRTKAVIRSCLGADMVNQICWKEDGHEMRNEQERCAEMQYLLLSDAQVVEKLTLISTHWADLGRSSSLDHASSNNPSSTTKDAESSSSSSFQSMSASQHDVPHVLQSLIRQKLIGPDSAPSVHEAPQLMAMIYDLDAVDAAFHKLTSNFPSFFQHRFAVKSCPLSFYLKRALDFGLGLECASLTEIQHALTLGCPGQKLVFDSPCKTLHELRFALEHQILVNADSFEELERIAQVIMEMKLKHKPVGLLRIGLRINPLVGAGSVAILSVSTSSSKFGIPLTQENRQRVISSFVKFPWLKALHGHVGSQGCDLTLLTQGAQTLVTLANEIDSVVNANQVQVLNIGGGLSVNYANEVVRPTLQDYAATLQRHVPELFTGHRAVMTEFGRSLVSKTAWVCSAVEYVKNKNSSTVPTAIIHAGSDLFVRPCYRPDLFRHEIELYTCAGEQPTCQKLKIQNIAGPLCFSGDVIAREREMPEISPGDYVVIRDAGSNTMSLFSRHCSRLAPIIYGYRKTSDATYDIQLLKEREKPEDVFNFWT